MTDKFYPYLVVAGKERWGCDNLADARRTAKKYGGVIREQVGSRNPATHDRQPAPARNPSTAPAGNVAGGSIAGEAEATRATIAILERRGQSTQAAAMRRELAAAVRAGNIAAVRAVRSKVVALFSGRTALRQNPGERPPAGFEGYYVESVGEAADTEPPYKRTKTYDVIAPDGTTGRLMSHGGKYRYHEQLDMFGHKRTAPPPEPAKVKAESRQIGLLFNPARNPDDSFQVDEILILNSPHWPHDVQVSYRGPAPDGQAVVWSGRSQMIVKVEWLRRAVQRNPLAAMAAGYAAGHVVDHATGHAVPRALKRALANPAIPQEDATNWLHNKTYKKEGREFVRTYPKIHGKREKAEVDVTAIEPLIKEIQKVNEWRFKLPRDPNAKPPRMARASREGCRVSPLVTKCAGDGVPWGDALMANGKTIEYVWQVLDLNDLRVSHNAETLTVNTHYPQELQPRDRSRQGYHDQIQRLVKDFDPALLMWSANASDGAPIIAPDGVVESGNGRSIALTRIYAHHPAKARQYMDTAKAWCKELGCKWPVWADSTGARPVLVRCRQTEVDRAEFARQANVAGQQVMSATEMAISDANALTPAILNLLDPNKEIGTGANAQFVGEFIKHVSGEASRGEMADAKGKLSKAGELRIDYALFARAWGSRAHNLVAAMAEVRESDLRTLLAALLHCAVGWAAFIDDMDAGRLPREYDETHNIVGMVQRVAAAKEQGATIHEMRAQADMLDSLTVEQNLWICAAFPKGRVPNAKTLASAIVNYINAVRAQGKPRPDMFGEVHATPAIDFVRAAVVKVVCGELPKTDAAQVALQTAQRFDDAATIAMMPPQWLGELSAATGMPVNGKAEIMAMARHIAPERRRNPPCRCGGKCGPCTTRGARSRSNRRAGR